LDYNSELREKIVSLFNYRMIPESVCSGKCKPELLEQLIDLQVAIYKLDHYLETTWELDQVVLINLWHSIEKIMSSIGYKNRVIHEYLREIRRYQTHEINLRYGYLPTRHNIEYFYLIKSCDVRLLRTIIIDHSEIRNTSLKDWYYFDLVTEINDDVEDVFEDQETINGNMFLISFFESGSSFTQDRFQNFINSIRRSSVTNETLHETINQAILAEADSTVSLMIKNLDLLSHAEIPVNIDKIFTQAEKKYELFGK